MGIFADRRKRPTSCHLRGMYVVVAVSVVVVIDDDVVNEGWKSQYMVWCVHVLIETEFCKLLLWLFKLLVSLS